jgi:DNA-binding beta-propeller fold protein YncE
VDRAASRRRRRLRFLALGPLVGLAACSGDVIGSFPSTPTPAITTSPTPELQEGILAEITIEGSPCSVAEAGGRVWVTAFDGNELNEIDPATNEVVETYRMPGGPCGMVERDGALWIETGNAGALVVFDPERREITDRVRIPGGVFGTTSTPSGLWGIAPGPSQVVQIDPARMKVVARIDVEGPLGNLAVEGDQLWTVAGREELIRIDTRTHAIAERIPMENFEPEGLAIDDDLLWVSSSFGGEVVRVDVRTHEVRDRVPVDGSLFGGIVIGGSYWVSGNNGTIFELDADTGELLGQRDLVGFGPFPASGNLWTVDFLSNAVFRLDEPAS